MSYRNRRVRTLAQFLLVDDDINVPASFQSGLITQQGRIKSSYGAYRLPIHVRRRRSRVTVFGLLRPAPNGKRARAAIMYRPRGSRKWRRIKRVTTRNSRNYFNTRVRARRGGKVRIAFRAPGAKRTIYSRTVRIR